jgi:hypothetical protein
MATRFRSKKWCPSKDPNYRQTDDYSMGYAVGKVTRWRYEPGADGKPQAVLPGAERKSVMPTRRLARVPQKPSDHGLFSDEADQLDLFEMFQD